MAIRAVYFLMLIALPALALANPATPPKRASGLWEVVPNSPFSWSICVNTDKDHLIEDDIWSNFDKECELQSQNSEENKYSFNAICEKTTKISGTIEGDFSSEYKATTTTSFSMNGKLLSQETTIKGRFLGECPLDMPAGTKRMKNGFTVKGLYENR